MPSLFPARALVHPSFVEPELIIVTSQASGFMDLLADRAPRVRLGDVDKFVYANRLDVRTQVVAQQASANLLPSATIVVDFLQTATYLVRTRAEYNEIDIAEAAEWKVGLPAAKRLAMRQGTFQYMRTACLFGVNASNSEGLLNTPRCRRMTPGSLPSSSS